MQHFLTIWIPPVYQYNMLALKCHSRLNGSMCHCRIIIALILKGITNEMPEF